MLCYNILHCSLSGPDPIYISLLIIFCIIENVTNKTLNPISGLASTPHTKMFTSQSNAMYSGEEIVSSEEDILYFRVLEVVALLK